MIPKFAKLMAVKENYFGWFGKIVSHENNFQIFIVILTHFNMKTDFIPYITITFVEEDLISRKYSHEIKFHQNTKNLLDAKFLTLK